ncbi:NAD(P)-binding protein [Exidia glandulosa HHB12029]|uniref:NAD(P)-binding protein n=1 Tax=Exidia glandulosa HHB12029 TaxID=1314781 RepID=A0A165P7Z4_EXIGL|nr:NAD(P)-binding protein [Exidia glandulosa HHB12029]
MKQFWWPGKVNGYENLEVRDVPIPKPGPGEVLVKIRAVSLNFRELLIARGQYVGESPEGLTPGADFAGEVVSSGGNSLWKAGDNVVATFYLGDIGTGLTEEVRHTALGAEYQGTLTEYRVFPASALEHIPAHMSFEEAATLSCAGTTAYTSLLGGPAPLKAGQTVVVQGTGGVSLFAAQIAVAAGARVIATSSSDEKLKFVKSLGVHDVINYKTTPAWESRVLELTGGKGADLIVDVAGGGSLSKSLSALRIGGQVVVIGILGDTTSPPDLLWKIMMKNALVRGVTVGDVVMFREFLHLLELHKIQPKVGKVFEFEKTKEAFACLEKQDFVGKVVIQVAKD